MRPTPPATDLRLRRLVHELNTPVGVSAMAASMLPAQMDTIVSALDARLRLQLDAELEAWRETVALVQNSLQLCVQVLANSARPAAPDKPQQPLPRISLRDTLQPAVAIQLARHPEVQARCQMHVAVGLQVPGDAGAWQQVVGNLVANSLLHGFAPERPGTIQISATRLPGNRLLLHYYDDGVGLNAEARVRLFEDGFSTRLERGGQGLGMGIVRELVHSRLHGHLEIHSPTRGVHLSIETPC